MYYGSGAASSNTTSRYPVRTRCLFDQHGGRSIVLTLYAPTRLLPARDCVGHPCTAFEYRDRTGLAFRLHGCPLCVSGLCRWVSCPGPDLLHKLSGCCSARCQIASMQVVSEENSHDCSAKQACRQRGRWLWCCWSMDWAGSEPEAPAVRLSQTMSERVRHRSHILPHDIGLNIISYFKICHYDFKI